jgi:hypothetical protein
MKKKWWIFSIFLAGGLVVLFQNCAGNMQAASLVSTGINSSFVPEPTPVPTPSSPIRVSLSEGKAGLNEPIQVFVDATRFPQGTAFLWDHLLGDGQVYCRQTSSLDRLNLTLSCPLVGALRVSLYITEPGGGEATLTVNLTVVESTGPGPSPTPTPNPLNGGALYTQHCSGCHGPLATSSKRQITISRLNSGISSVSTMAGLSSLNAGERQAIVTALQ